jgi:transcriptional regulator NrdR family protein
MPDKYNQIGIHCPHCGIARSGVTHVRSHAGRTFRRRRCKGCSKLFTTAEHYVAGTMRAAVFPKKEDQ